MVGDIVKVVVDRPLGSYHPKHKDMHYPINYGYIEGIIAPDGEEQDAYIIGVDELAPEAVGQKAADERAHRRTEGIRAHGAQDGHPHVVEVESNRPGRQRHTRGHDAAGVEEVGE